jgi:hypothetical protein
MTRILETILEFEGQSYRRPDPLRTWIAHPAFPVASPGITMPEAWFIWPTFHRPFLCERQGLWPPRLAMASITQVDAMSATDER